MKYLTWFAGILATIFVAVYVVVFTTFGNGLLQPIIQDKIRQEIKLESNLKTFSLSMSEFEIFLELNSNNNIHIKGNYSLFSQAFNVAYRVSLEELKTLKSLTQTQLQSSFYTDGTVIGNLAFVTVEGKSDLVKSATTYHIELTDFNPTSIIAKIQNADLASLLYMLNQKQYATAKINLDVNFKNIKPHQLDGSISLLTQEGKLNSLVMKKDFNITIPTTEFGMNLNANLKDDDLVYKYLLNSNLAKITSSGKVTPEPLAVDIKYGVNVEELAVLKPITGADIRGALHLNGDVKGNKAKMVVNGKSDFAASDTSFTATLQDFQPANIKARIKNMQLQKVLYMVKQPHFADAFFSLDADISDARSGKLKGKINTSIQQGLVDSAYMTKAYEFKSMMPTTTFSAATATTLNGNVVDTKVDVLSNLANLNINKASFDISDTSLKSDYEVKVHDLDRLYFASERHLKGSLSANGELKKAKDLDFTLLSNVAGGKLDAKLHNDDFVANINSMGTLEVLDMLLYPKIFDSSINGVVNYNLAEQKGTFKGELKNGKFTKNQVLDLAKQYANADLYKETFLGDVNANINKENILASLDLKSNRSAIITKDTKLNSKTQQINSKIDINANGNPLIVTLTGNVNAPNVAVDANELIQKEATKAIQKEAEKYLGKDASKLFKSLF
jgi:hypothetical protein